MLLSHFFETSIFNSHIFQESLTSLRCIMAAQRDLNDPTFLFPSLSSYDCSGTQIFLPILFKKLRVLPLRHSLSLIKINSCRNLNKIMLFCDIRILRSLFPVVHKDFSSSDRNLHKAKNILFCDSSTDSHSRSEIFFERCFATHDHSDIPTCDSDSSQLSVISLYNFFSDLYIS
jgi:hypothetical protein